MMIYNGELLKLNGKAFRCITAYKVGRNKLWSSDTGRNMAGSMKGTLIGNFPKIMLEIEPLEAEEMKELVNIFDAASITVDYYSIKYQCMCRGSFYSNDYEEETFLQLLPHLKYKPFTVNLIAKESEENHVKIN